MVWILGNSWEWKIDEGESIHSAVEREILEELCISVFAMDEVSRISHRYEDRIVDLTIIDCGVIDPNSVTSWNMTCQDG